MSENSINVEEALRLAGTTPCGCSEAEYRKLYELVLSVPDLHGGVVVEVGAGYGGSTVMLAAAAVRKDWTVYSIDPFHLGLTDYTEKCWRRTGWFRYKTFETYNDHLISAGLRQCIVSVVGDSQAVCPILRFSNGIAFVWIDGEHSHPHAITEWRGMAPQVVSGGIVAFHDCHKPHVAWCIKDLVEAGDMNDWTELDLPEAGIVIKCSTKLIAHQGKWSVRAWRKN